MSYPHFIVRPRPRASQRQARRADFPYITGIHPTTELTFRSRLVERLTSPSDFLDLSSAFLLGPAPHAFVEVDGSCTIRSGE